MKLIFGLGNPAEVYKFTRHNIGFMTIDNLAKLHKVKKFERASKYKFSNIEIDNIKIVLIKPKTFMNNSGVAVIKALNDFNESPQNILVVCDDVNLPLGKLRLRNKGSAGGHNGLQSIIDTLQTEEFPRLRIGIDKPQSKNLTNYVLSNFTASDLPIIQDTIEKACNTVINWIINIPVK